MAKSLEEFNQHRQNMNEKIRAAEVLEINRFFNLDNAVYKDKILDGADARIEKYRKGDAVLRLLGPDGKALETSASVNVEQTRHKFLFGCNIFKLNRCRTPEDNAAYAKRFAELLNYATLPFYWWSYERQRGKPDDGRRPGYERIPVP